MFKNITYFLQCIHCTISAVPNHFCATDRYRSTGRGLGTTALYDSPSIHPAVNNGVIHGVTHRYPVDEQIDMLHR